MSEKANGSDERLETTRASTTPVLKEHINRRLAMCSLISCSGAYAYGFTQAIIASSLGQPELTAYFGSLTTKDISMMTGLQYAGGIVGVFVIHYFVTIFGRKWGFFSCALFIWLGAGLGAGSTSIGMFVAGRFFIGMGSWGYVLCATLYNQELAPASRRGALAGAVGVALSCGYITAAWTGVGFFFYTSKYNWRVPLALQAFFPLVTTIGLFFIPESPRWLASKGQGEKALEVLKYIHYDPLDPEYKIARTEHYQIVRQVALDSTLPASWLSMFQRYRKRTFCAVLVSAAAQATGVQIVTNFGPQLYASLGYTAEKSLLVAAAWQTFGVTCNSFGALTNDWLGRRTILVTATFGAGLCMALEAAAVATYLRNGSIACARLAVAAFFIFIFFYQLGEPVQYVYFGEAFPTNVRPKGIALSLATTCIMSLWITQAQPYAVANITYGYYILFVVIASIGALMQWLWIPETKGVRLEEMPELFGDAEAVAIHAHDAQLALERAGISEEV